MSTDREPRIGPGLSGLALFAIENPRFALRAARGMRQARWSLRKATNLGSRVRVKGRPRVVNDGVLNVGERVRIVSTVATTELVVSRYGKMEIGVSTFINYGCSITASCSVHIGANCNIGTHVMMMDNEFHRIEPERRNETPESAAIHLGDNVWVGGRAIILSGVTIGDDSVIGAGSIVTSNVPPRSIAAGVPAKVLRAI